MELDSAARRTVGGKCCKEAVEKHFGGFSCPKMLHFPSHSVWQVLVFCLKMLK